MSKSIKKIIASIAMTLIGSSMLLAQSSERFIKKYYPEPNLNALCTGVATTGYGYMLAGLVEEAGGYYTYCLTGLDQNGEELWQKKYGDANRSFLPHYDPDAAGMGALSKGDGFYYAIVLTHEAADSLFTTLFKFNEQGDTLWTKTLRGDEEHAFIYGNCVRLLPNGNFGVVGTVENSNWIPGEEVAKNLSFLSILDSEGNQLWRKKYDWTLVTCKDGDAIIIMLSMAYDPMTNRYFLVGKVPYSADQCQSRHSYIILLDHEGNAILQGYGAPWLSYTDVKMLSNGNVAVGGYMSWWDPTERKFMDMPYLFFYTMDLAPIMNWSFYPNCQNYVVHSRFFQIEELEGDTIMAVGVTDTQLDQNWNGQNSMFFIYKIFDQYKTAWRRVIDIDPQAHDYCTTMALTADGGFALAGYSRYEEHSPMVLVKTDARGCVEEGCTEGDWLVDFEADRTAIRAGEEVTFTNLSLGATYCYWDFEGGANISGQTVTYPNPGTYSVSLTAVGCMYRDTKYKENYITVLPLAPAADFTADQTVVQAGASVTFSNLSQHATSYSWYFEGGDPETSALKNPIVTYRTEGRFDVRLTVANIVGEDEEFKADYITVNAVGIDEQEEASSAFALFPNPAQGAITFEYPYAEGATVTVEIYNLAGQLVDRVTMAGSQQAYRAEHLANSIYFATLKVDGKIVSTQKMVLIK